MVDLRALLPGLAAVEDDGLRARILDTWESAVKRSPAGDRIAELPFTVKAPDESLFRHIGRVVEVARVLYRASVEQSLPAVDSDVLMGACLLHDVDKVCLVQPSAAGGWEPSREARRYPHGVLGAMLCREHAIPDDIVHIVATHSTTSTLPPEPFEGVVLHYADLFAADAALFAAGQVLLMAPKPR
jgi:putative nucleotidyltransferase with HDIG domain